MNPTWVSAWGECHRHTLKGTVYSVIRFKQFGRRSDPDFREEVERDRTPAGRTRTFRTKDAANLRAAELNSVSPPNRHR